MDSKQYRFKFFDRFAALVGFGGRNNGTVGARRHAGDYKNYQIIVFLIGIALMWGLAPRVGATLIFDSSPDYASTTPATQWQIHDNSGRSTGDKSVYEIHNFITWPTDLNNVCEIKIFGLDDRAPYQATTTTMWLKITDGAGTEKATSYYAGATSTPAGFHFFDFKLGNCFNFKAGAPGMTFYLRTNADANDNGYDWWLINKNSTESVFNVSLWDVQNPLWPNELHNLLDAGLHFKLFDSTGDNGQTGTSTIIISVPNPSEWCLQQGITCGGTFNFLSQGAAGVILPALQALSDFEQSWTTDSGAAVNSTSSDAILLVLGYGQGINQIFADFPISQILVLMIFTITSALIFKVVWYLIKIVK